MFGTILALLDGSPMADRILPHVAAIAQIAGQSVEQRSSQAITLLRVLETGAEKSTAVDPLTWHFAEAEAQAHLDESAQYLARLGLASNTALLKGASAQQIVEYAHKHRVELLVLSSHGQGGMSNWHVGGVAQKVIHHAGTSVLLVRSSGESAEERRGAVDAETTQYRHILVPLDGSQRAESTLPLAKVLAERHAAELLVIHVATRPEMMQRVPLSPEDAALAQRMVERNVLEADKYFAQLQSRLPAKTQTCVLVNESVPGALHGLIAQEDIDLVVLCAHGHSCNSAWPYGTLVNSFITHGATSLLIVQDLPTNATRRPVAERGAEDVTMPTRRANDEEGLNLHAHFEV